MQIKNANQERVNSGVRCFNETLFSGRLSIMQEQEGDAAENTTFGAILTFGNESLWVWRPLYMPREFQMCRSGFFFISAKKDSNENQL